MASAEQIAWAAGLFEGEGCISVRWGGSESSKGHRYCRLSLRMNDGDVVKRIYDIMGVGNLYGPCMPPVSSGNRKPFWDWHVGHANDCEFVIRTFLPFFGARRSARAIEALELLARIERRAHRQPKLVVGHRCKNKHLLLGSNVGRGRDGRLYCLPCSRNYQSVKRGEKN